MFQKNPDSPIFDRLIIAASPQNHRPQNVGWFDGLL
jgi:hypothetical protein